MEVKPRYRIFIPRNDDEDVEFHTLPWELFQLLAEQKLNGNKQFWRDCTSKDKKTRLVKRKVSKPRKRTWVRLNKNLAVKLNIDFYALCDLILGDKVRTKFDRWNHKMVHYNDLMERVGKGELTKMGSSS